MSETQAPVSNSEIDLPEKWETSEEAIERLANIEIAIVPDTDPDDGTLHYRYVGYTGPNDSYIWHQVFIGKPSGEVRELEADNPEDSKLVEDCVTNVRNDELLLTRVARNGEGRWWLYRDSLHVLDKAPVQVLRVEESDNHLDVVNSTDSRLSEAEVASVQKVFSTIAALSGGKIFERVRGVMIVPEGVLPENVSGQFNKGTGVLRIGMDILRMKNDSRFQKYFKDSDVTRFELTLAHELGHAMDIQSVEEAKAHGIDTESRNWGHITNFTSDFSAFDDKFGWAHESIIDERGHLSDQHTYTEEGAIECEEFVPTEYGKTSPREDFADTFAIVCMGGDTSTISQRAEVIKRTLNLAEGEAKIGPKLVTVEEIPALSLIKPVSRIKLTAYLNVADPHKVLRGES